MRLRLTKRKRSKKEMVFNKGQRSSKVSDEIAGGVKRKERSTRVEGEGEERKRKQRRKLVRERRETEQQ